MNLRDVLVFTDGDYDIKTEEYELITISILEFEQITRFSLLNGTPFTLIFENYVQGSYFEMIDDVDADFYDAGEFFLSNLVVDREYSLMFVDPNGNYKNSEHIRFRVVSP